MNQTKSAMDLISIIRGRDSPQKIKPTFKIGTIPSNYTPPGYPTIIFDGETTATSRKYPYMMPYRPSPGDRVIVATLQNSGIIIGKIASNAGDDLNNILTASGTISMFRMAIQDGSGRFEMYWNADGGGTNTYHVSNEAAWKFIIDPTNGMQVLFAPAGTAGNTITWSTAAIPSGAWKTPSYQNSWVPNGDANYKDATYFKDLAGIVRVEGLVKAPASGATSYQTIFQLPTGYRPSKNLIFACDMGDGFISVQVGSDGSIQCRSTPTANQWISLSNISFMAEQ